MINQYQYFLAVAKYGNLHRAADSLFISQPALSASVKRLESELGVQLLEKKGRNIELTDIAKRLLPYMQELCKSYADMHEAANLYTLSLTQQVVLGTCIRHTIISVDEYLLTYPGKTVKLQQYFKYVDLCDALLHQKIDLCIAAPTVRGAGICSEVIIKEPLGLLARTDDPLAGRSSISFADACSRMTYRHPEGYPFNMILDRIGRELGQSLPKPNTVADNAALLLALLSERGREHVLINPISRCREIVGLHKTLTFIPIEEEQCYRDIGVSWLEKRPLDSNARHLIDYLYSYYEQSKYRKD